MHDLILVRHGVTDWNEAGRLMGRLPIRLNSRGQEQAAAVARALAAVPVRAVYASPQARAQQTAEYIARQHGVPLQADPALAEVWLGRWQEKTYAELREDVDVARFLANPTHVCDAFEPSTEVHARIVGFVEQLRISEGAPGAVVMVSHGDPLRILIAHLLGMEIGAYRRFVIDPASVTLARFGQSGHRILTLNWSAAGPVALPLTP